MKNGLNIKPFGDYWKMNNSIGGELTAEIFETWYPDKPEVLLLDFLTTGNVAMFCVIKIDEENVGICHITRSVARKLLDEFKILRGNT